MGPNAIERLCWLSQDLAKQGELEDAETVLRFAMAQKLKCQHGQGMKSECNACNPPRLVQ